MAQSASQVHISIPSRYENLDLVDLVAEAAMQHLGLDEETVENASLAVREAAANGVQHGNSLAVDKRVDIDLDLLDGEVVIRVSDQGRGFDPAAVPDPLAPENLLKPRGRGIFLMRRLMDRVDFEFTESGATVVTLRKKIQASESAQEAQETKG